MTRAGTSPERRMIVFGGSSGIGLAAATLAIKAGYRVTVADVDAAGAQLPVVTEERCQFAVCDVTDPAQVDRALAEAPQAASRTAKASKGMMRIFTVSS